MEAVLAEWEAFASTLAPAATRMTPLALRDHARQILEAVAMDLSTPQTEHAQAEKSKGRAPIRVHAPETAAQTHAVLRAQSGFDINQLAAEYRALRASVLRLWVERCPALRDHFDDVVRFNEAIDQALAESIHFFSAQVDRARDLLLGMLGHDMRTPLNAVVLTAGHLKTLNAGAEVSDAASSLIRCGASMKALLDDLVDFNRTRLGMGINVTVAETDLELICTDEIEQQLAANPGRQILLKVTGAVKGVWDPARLQQVIRNLIANALKYGAKEAPVILSLEGEATSVRLDVRNRGRAIDPAAFEQIFDPLTRAVSDAGDAEDDGGLGLGLYIVREVVRAHGGEVKVRSDNEETVFTVVLPRARHNVE